MAFEQIKKSVINGVILNRDDYGSVKMFDNLLSCNWLLTKFIHNAI